MSLIADLNNLLVSKEGRAIINKAIMSIEKLEALEAGGVDNWTWYSESLQPWLRKYFPGDYEDENPQTP